MFAKKGITIPEDDFILIGYITIIKATVNTENN